VIHGLKATGKSAVTKAVLEALSSTTSNNSEDDNPLYLRYAIVRSAECIGGRHLLEQTVGAIVKALEWEGTVGRCENIAQLVVELGRLVENWIADKKDVGRRRVVLVFDGIDSQRDAPPTLLPALARLGEVVSHCQTLAGEISHSEFYRSPTSRPYLSSLRLVPTFYTLLAYRRFISQHTTRTNFYK
jgi:origin recognition complex subunit 5